MKKMHILGGGPAGLAVAYFASKKNIPFNIYESKSTIGGNCKTLNFDECSFDTGAHRFHNKNTVATSAIKSLIKNDLITVNAPSKIYWDSKMTPFPLEPKSLMADFQTLDVLKIFYENTINLFNRKKNISSFKEAAFRKYGRTISEKFLINYSEKLWGVSAKTLHREVTGDRFKDLTPLALIKSLINYSNKNSKHLEGDFLYPKNGYGQIFKAIEDIVSNNIKYNCSIDKIYSKNNLIDEIGLSNGDRIKTDTVISTLPLDYFTEIFNPGVPDAIISLTNSLKFRNLRLGIFTLNCDNFSKNASIYFPERKFAFTRIYEPKNRSITMAPRGKTCIVVEVPFSSGDTIGKIHEDEFLNKIQDLLSKNDIVKKSLFLDSTSMIMHNAYPIITKESKIRLEKINDYYKYFLNLKIIGRNAQFKYLHTHHLFNDAFNNIDKFLEEKSK